MHAIVHVHPQNMSKIRKSAQVSYFVHFTRLYSFQRYRKSLPCTLPQKHILLSYLVFSGAISSDLHFQ